MNLDERLELITEQERAFVEGIVECIGDQWIFFDDVNERAFQLNELGEQFEIYKGKKWHSGKLVENGIFQVEGQFIYLRNSDELRYPKELNPQYEEWLEELDDVSFHGFVKMLNDLSYSIFDCIYCHNFLSFLKSQKLKEGVNVFIFDNEEMICNVQHHFKRGSTNKDRFEFTLCNGTRKICGNLK